MNISEEKAFVYSMMRDVTAERRELTKIYHELKIRLDELDKLELRGLEDVAIKGYVDAANIKNAALAIANITRETNHIIDKIHQEAEPKVKSVIPKLEIDQKKDDIAKIDKVSRGASLEKITGIIAHVLKEYGTPMSVKDLFEAVNERVDNQISRNNFRNNILPRAVKKNKNISSATRGFYQYLIK